MPVPTIPSVPMTRSQILHFFTRSLTAFHSSQDAFRVLCTAPHHPLAPRLPPPPPPPPSSGVDTLVVLDSSFNPPTRAHAQMAKSAMESAGPGARLLLLLAVNNADKGCAGPAAGLAPRLGMMEGFARELARGARGGGGGGGDDDAEMEIDVAVTTGALFHEKARSIAGSGVYGGDVRQVYLCGFDTVIRIFDPRYYRGEPAGAGTACSSCGGASEGEGEGEGVTAMQRALRPFFARAKLRVMMRPDDEWGSAEEQRAWVDGLGDGGLEGVGGVADWAGRVELVEGVEGVEGVVSSSRVREVVRRGGGGDEMDGMVGEEVRRWIEEEGLYR